MHPVRAGAKHISNPEQKRDTVASLLMIGVVDLCQGTKLCCMTADHVGLKPTITRTTLLTTLPTLPQKSLCEQSSRLSDEAGSDWTTTGACFDSRTHVCGTNTWGDAKSVCTSQARPTPASYIQCCTDDSLVFRRTSTTMARATTLTPDATAEHVNPFETCETLYPGAGKCIDQTMFRCAGITHGQHDGYYICPNLLICCTAGKTDAIESQPPPSATPKAIGTYTPPPASPPRQNTVTIVQTTMPYTDSPQSSATTHYTDGTTAAIMTARSTVPRRQTSTPASHVFAVASNDASLRTQPTMQTSLPASASAPRGSRVVGSTTTAAIGSVVADHGQPATATGHGQSASTANPTVALAVPATNFSHTNTTDTQRNDTQEDASTAVAICLSVIVLIGCGVAGLAVWKKKQKQTKVLLRRNADYVEDQGIAKAS